MKKTAFKFLSVLLLALVTGAVLCGCFIKTPDQYYGGGGSLGGSEGEDGKVSVVFSVSCMSILSNFDRLDPAVREGGFVPENGVIYPETEIFVKDKETVLNVLIAVAKDSRIALSFTGGYVQSIAHIAEFDCGKNSGWLFLINGKQAAVGAGSARVKKGDRIQWKYTVDPGDAA